MCWLNKHVIFFLILLPCMDHHLVLPTLWPAHVVTMNFFAACFTPWTSYWACFLFHAWNQTAAMINFVLLSFILSFCLIVCTLFISTSLHSLTRLVALLNMQHPEVKHDTMCLLHSVMQEQPEAHLSAYVLSVFYKTVYQCVQCIFKLSNC